MMVWKGELISDMIGAFGLFPHQQYSAVPCTDLKENTFVIPIILLLSHINADISNSLVDEKPKSSHILKVQSTKLV